MAKKKYMLQVSEILEGELVTEINFDFITLKRVNKIIKALGNDFKYLIDAAPIIKVNK